MDVRLDAPAGEPIEWHRTIVLVLICLTLVMSVIFATTVVNRASDYYAERMALALPTSSGRH